MNSYKILFCSSFLGLCCIFNAQAQIDTTALFYLDGNPIEYQREAWMFRLNEAEFAKGEGLSVRNALLHFGEKARHGMWVIQSKEHEKSMPLQKDEFRIHGQVNSDFNGSPVMLFTFKEHNSDEIDRVDTTTVVEGKFSFRGKVYPFNLSIITLGNYPGKVFATEVVLEHGEIKVSLDSSRASGTALNDSLQQFYTLPPKDISLYREFIRHNLHNAVGKNGIYPLRGKHGSPA